LATLRDPVASDGPKEHADWLELLALHSSDGNSSYQDLVASLRRAGTVDAVSERRQPDQGSEISQQLADSAFAELDTRSRSCGDQYPFVVADQHIQLRNTELSAGPYAFMLMLKAFGVKAGPRTVRGATNFEELAAIAASNYLGGEDAGAKRYHFGFPRRVTPGGFRAALDDLCHVLGEGGGSRSRPSRRHQKDAKLDLVAWRPFEDQRIGKLIAFGQCAAGDGYDAKATELVPQQFCRLWMREPPMVQPLVFFFVPRCVDDEEWETIHAIGNTLLFDRCRITGLLMEISVPVDLISRTAKWCRYVIGSGTA
jgi:hypothetical protein